MAKKLSELDSDFRAQHHALVDLIEGDDILEREQETLDTHDDLLRAFCPDKAGHLLFFPFSDRLIS